MGEVYSFGKMENFIQATGKMIKGKEKVQIIILMEIYMKGSIKMEKKKEKVPISGKMEIFILVIGKMI